MILFSRLILLAEREQDATPCFEYELTNYPLSFFKDGIIRSGNKASLRNYLTKGIPNANLPTEIVPLIEGEALLYQVNGVHIKSFPIFVSYTKEICIANSDTSMLCSIVKETDSPQKMCNT